MIFVDGRADNVKRHLEYLKGYLMGIIRHRDTSGARDDILDGKIMFSAPEHLLPLQVRPASASLCWTKVDERYEFDHLRLGHLRHLSAYHTLLCRCGVSHRTTM